MADKGYPAVDFDSDPKMARRSTNSCWQCVRVTPWLSFLSAMLFAGGLITWAVTATKTKDLSMQFVNELGAPDGSASAIDRGMWVAIVVVGVVGCVAVALVTLLAFFRATTRARLLGGCCSGCSRPAPWVFTFFRGLNGITGFLMWLLLAAVTLLLMAMLLWLGAALAVRAGISHAVSKGNAELPNGAFGAASNLSNDLISALNGIVPSDTASVLSGSVCPPVCLNMGSFGVLLNLDSSCLCGTAKLNSMNSIASQATTSSAIALGGALAMWIAVTFLLMLSTAHQVTAAYDRKRARFMQATEAAAYENGRAADPADVAPLSRGGSGIPTMSRSNSLKARDVEAAPAAQAPVAPLQALASGAHAQQHAGGTYNGTSAYDSGRYAAYV